MQIQPKIRGFICTTAHPTGCFQSVLNQMNYIKTQPKLQGAKRVLIIGASTGYGLASRITAAFASDAKTIGVAFEKPADDKRTASPGWYNTAAFEMLAHQAGLYAKSVNGDAFSDAIKQQTIDLIKQDLGQVDLVIYSLAAPRRMHPVSGELFSSVLKPIDQSFTSKTIDVFKGEVKEINIEPATQEEIQATIAVMGGEDWEMWINALLNADALAAGCKTIAYSYIGPELTYPIYKNGTIGKAKENLKSTADKLNQQLSAMNGSALISVNKALVTQASAAIPVVPLYVALLYKCMKTKGTHEGCIEQIYRLFRDYLCADKIKTDAEGNIRIDDLEMQQDIQAEIAQLWPKITTENVEALTDIVGYREEFYHLFGFDLPHVDYDAEVDPNIMINSIKE